MYLDWYFSLTFSTTKQVPTSHRVLPFHHSFPNFFPLASFCVEVIRNVMAHGDAWEGKWRGNRLLERVACASEHGLSMVCPPIRIPRLPAHPHSSTASSRLNWLPRRFKWTRPFLWKTKSGFCACAIAFQTCSTTTGYYWAFKFTAPLNAFTNITYIYIYIYIYISHYDATCEQLKVHTVHRGPHWAVPYNLMSLSENY